MSDSVRNTKLCNHDRQRPTTKTTTCVSVCVAREHMSSVQRAVNGNRDNTLASCFVAINYDTQLHLAANTLACLSRSANRGRPGQVCADVRSRGRTRHDVRHRRGLVTEQSPCSGAHHQRCAGPACFAELNNAAIVAVASLCLGLPAGSRRSRAPNHPHRSHDLCGCCSRFCARARSHVIYCREFSLMRRIMSTYSNMNFAQTRALAASI